MNTLVEHKCVISIAAQVILGVEDEHARVHQVELEENKQEI